MRKTVEILNVAIDYATMEDALFTINTFLESQNTHAVYTPNSEIMMAAQRDKDLRHILNNGDLVVADGAGVVLASRILNLNLPQKVSGFDLVVNLLKSAHQRKIRLFLLGGKPGIAELAAENIKKTYPGVEISGCRNGYFNKEEQNHIIDAINSSDTDVLLVALGAPKQEKWIHEHKHNLKVKVCIGVGGTLDVLSGKVSLAPEFFRKNGLEWLYRLYKEPWRYKRMLDLPRFIARVLLEKAKILLSPSK